MTALFHFIVRHDGYKLISDRLLSVGREALWKSIISRNSLNISIIDINTDTQHKISEVGKILPDGTTLLSPEKDDPADETKQRFFYLAESNMSIDHNGHSVKPIGLTEKRNRFGVVHSSEYTRGPFYQPMYIFGDGQS